MCFAICSTPFPQKMRKKNKRRRIFWISLAFILQFQQVLPEIDILLPVSPALFSKKSVHFS